MCSEQGQGNNKQMFVVKKDQLSILLNIMIFAPMGRFQLELIYIFHRPSIKQKQQLFDGRTVENKGKLIL